jgi:SPOC domain
MLQITMPLDSTIPQETPVVARQLGGRHLEHHSPLWKTLFPSELLRIDGRVPVENSNKFLLHMRMNTAKELIAVAFSPTSETSDVGFRILSDVLIAKGYVHWFHCYVLLHLFVPHFRRHGLVFPWGHHPKDHHPGRELYIIPLLSSDPLPDFIELMDNMNLPKVRKVNYLIGIWVLTKGKLASPPAPPPPPALPQIPANLLPLLNPGPSLPVGATQPPQSMLPAAIAAEVATLTPEQIQLMIQTLAGNGTFPPVPAPISPQTQVPPSQQHLHAPAPPSVPPQPWPNTAQGYRAPYPVPNSQLHPSPPHQQSYYDRDFRTGPGYDRHDRGDASSGRGDRGGWRGRGRGSGRGHESPRKPVDSGWPRRRPQNNDGGAPPPPPASSSPRRW